jgi:hypothetical protein
MTQTEKTRGLCFCGCGRPTSLATATERRRGNVKGEPVKYIRGHTRTPRERLLRPKLPVVFAGDVAIVTLVGGQKVTVDNDVPALLGNRRLSFTSHGYVVVGRERPGTRQEYLHRLLMRPGRGLTVDHINGDRLDNRRANLRVCTMQQNSWNTPAQTSKQKSSRYKGVSRGSVPNLARPWCAQVCVNGQIVRCGWFATELEAAMAYDEAARRHFGDFARPNFPNQVPTATHARADR